MTRNAKSRSKPRRLATLVAALALAGALGGCVVYPAGYGYGYRGGDYGYHGFYGFHHDDDDGFGGHWHH